MLRSLIAIILICFAAWAAVAEPSPNFQCRSLVELNEQWKGASLTKEQAAIKAQLEAWYYKNCETKRFRRSKAKLIRDDGRYSQVNPEIKQWFNTLTNQKGGLCCSMADGFSIDDPEWSKGAKGYAVRIDGQWIDVPEVAVVSGGNRIGRAIVWPVKSEGVTFIRCFMPGAET